MLIDCVLVQTWHVTRIANLADLLKRMDRWKIAWSLNGVPADVQRAIDFFMYRKPARRRRMLRKRALIQRSSRSNV